MKLKKCLKCGEDRPEIEFIKDAKQLCALCSNTDLRFEPKGAAMVSWAKREIGAIIIEYDDGILQRYNKEENNENKK